MTVMDPELAGPRGGVGPAAITSSNPAEAAVVRSRPAGLVAAVLAMAIAVAWLHVYAAGAQRLATQDARMMAPLDLPFKAQTLTLQRAALRHPDLLPIYGTSELYCCGDTYTGPAFYAHAPSGFALFAVGYPITGDLFFAQTFGALASELRGRRIVLSDSPWFTADEGVGRGAYDSTFSPEIAETFTFDAPVPAALRAAVARRMLDYPETLRDHPILRLGLRALAQDTRWSRAEYGAVAPIGRLIAWVAQLQDARDTVRLLHSRQWSGSQVGDQPRRIDWPWELSSATVAAAAESSNNPFGIANRHWANCTDVEPPGQCAAAMALYRAGENNRTGAVYAYPSAWAEATLASPGWGDLRLELEMLHSVGAQPLVWMQPMQGAYDDHTPISAPVRDLVYSRFQQIAAQAGVPATTWQGHDADPLFMITFAHFSPRGWAYADRMLDLFWHGRLDLSAPDLAQGGGGDAGAPSGPGCSVPRACAGPGPAAPG